MQFWFCRQAGLALPLIALQYHEVKVNLTFRAQSKLLCTMTKGGDDWQCSGGDKCDDVNGLAVMTTTALLPALVLVACTVLSKLVPKVSLLVP